MISQPHFTRPLAFPTTRCCVICVNNRTVSRKGSRCDRCLGDHQTHHTTVSTRLAASYCLADKTTGDGDGKRLSALDSAKRLVADAGADWGKALADEAGDM